MSTIPPEITSPESELPHREQALATMIQLREVARRISGFALAATGRRRQIVGTATLPIEFLRAAAVCCEAAPQIATAMDLDVAKFRDAIAFVEEYPAVVEEMRIIAKGGGDTLAEHRNTLGQIALTVYSMAKSSNRWQNRELIVPHVETMKRLVNRGRQPRKTDAEKAKAAALKTNTLTN